MLQVLDVAQRRGNSAAVRLIVAAVIAFAALYHFDESKIDLNQFALARTVRQTEENWKSRQFTAWSVPHIQRMVADYQRNPLVGKEGCPAVSFLWLGNSQLHGINQNREGDHIAPYWTRQALPCPDATVPLGVSIPNSNFQELYALDEYVTSRLPIKFVVIELCFDSLRQDGLRREFSGFLTGQDEGTLSQEPAGREMVKTAEALWNGQKASVQNPGLNGFVQQHIENYLDTELSKAFYIWRDRSNLQGKLEVQLYFLRNSVFGIKPSTVRKLIGPRYVRNMQAMRALLKYNRAKGIHVLGYIAPIRNDLPIPYDVNEYNTWKRAITETFQAEGAEVVNIESLVPPGEWGRFDETGEIDFIHFRNGGHELVTGALLSRIRDMVQKD